MSEILQANIFFVITSIAVLVFTLFVCVILYHVIKILRSIRTIVTRFEEGSELIAEDMSQLRAYVIEGSLVSQIMSFFLGKKARKAPPLRKSKDVTSED
jgi:succinate dehydrogenase/fumarate reductase cytochrome b subunit